MSIRKIRQLILGPGNITDTSIQSTVRAENSNPTVLDGTDGDVWITTGPANRENIWLKVDGYWHSLVDQPVLSNLLDNQANALAFALPTATFKRADIEFTLKRPDWSRSVSGTLKIVTDGATVNFSERFVDLGAASGVDFDVVINGANLEIRYTSTNESIAPIMEWSIARGWN